MQSDEGLLLFEEFQRLADETTPLAEPTKLSEAPEDVQIWLDKIADFIIKEKLKARITGMIALTRTVENFPGYNNDVRKAMEDLSEEIQEKLKKLEKV